MSPLLSRFTDLRDVSLADELPNASVGTRAISETDHVLGLASISDQPWGPRDGHALFMRSVRPLSRELRTYVSTPGGDRRLIEGAVLPGAFPGGAPDVLRVELSGFAGLLELTPLGSPLSCAELAGVCGPFTLADDQCHTHPPEAF